MTTARKAKKTGTKKNKVPPPGKESRAVFSAALAIAKDLLKSTGLKINLDANGNIEFVIDAEKLGAIPKDKFKGSLTPDHFLTLISTEFESLIKVSSYPDPTRGLQNEIPSKILNHVGKEEFLWRFEQVKKELVPPNLEERVMFRRTSQGFVLQNATWQVITKKHDQTRGKLSDIPCGCLSITYGSPQTHLAPVRFGTKGVSFELPTVREPNQLTLELHQVDVEELIESLTDLRDNLEKLKKGK